MIKAILFDLFQTLVTEHGTEQRRASSLGALFDLDPRHFRAAWKPRRPRVVRGELRFGEALVEVGTQLGVVLPAAAVQQACELRVRQKSTVFERVDPDLVETIRALHDRGLRLAVVSNCFAEDVEGWSGSALAPWFDAAVFSFAAGAAKPEPEIYVEAARRVAVSPADALFIGDGVDDELEGATRAGMRAARAAWYVKPAAHASGSAIPVMNHWRDVRDLVPAG